MIDIKKLKEIYASVVSCNNSSCPISELKMGENERPPRGFWFNQKRYNDILLIAINPGTNLNRKQEEIDFYESKKGIDLVERHLMYVEKRFTEEKRTNYFNELLKALKLTFFEEEEPFYNFNYTNFVKCGTKIKWSDLTSEKRDILMENCFKKHLCKEICLLKPKLILTYGNVVFEFIQSRVPVKVIKLPRRGQGNVEAWENRCLELNKKLKTFKRIKDQLKKGP